MSPDSLPVKRSPSHWLLCDISIICGCFKFPISFSRVWSRSTVTSGRAGSRDPGTPGWSVIINTYNTHQRNLIVSKLDQTHVHLVTLLARDGSRHQQCWPLTTDPRCQTPVTQWPLSPRRCLEIQIHLILDLSIPCLPGLWLVLKEIIIHQRVMIHNSHRRKDERCNFFENWQEIELNNPSVASSAVCCCLHPPW